MSDVYQMVTDRILEDMSNGVIPWRKPWIGTGGAYNAITGKKYGLVNAMLLKHDGAYCSIKGWNQLHGKVKKGEKGEKIVFFKMEEKQVSETDETETVGKQFYPVWRCFTVFHYSQLEEGVDPFPLPAQPERFHHNPVKEAEDVFWKFIQSTGINFQQEQSDRAYYLPVDDLIHVPTMEQFWDSTEYYGTLFHEAVHATGHPTRLNRPGLRHVSFGSTSATYSREELVAETGSAMLLGTIGLITDSSRVNSAAYIQGWMEAIRADWRMFLHAAGAAEKAARFILKQSGRSPDVSNATAQQ